MVLVLAVFHLLAARAAQARTNLVQNPNFEQVDSSGKPLNWTLGGSAFRRSTAQHLPGASASLQYDNDDPAIFQLTTQLVHGAQPGHQYTLSAAIRAQGLNATAFGGGATICAQWNAPPFYGGYLGGGPSGWTNWTTQSLTFVYPPSAPPLSVAAYVRPLVEGTNRTPTGVAYFGNFSLVHDPPPPLRSVLLSPVYRGRISAADPSPITIRAHLRFELEPGGSVTVVVVATLHRTAAAGAAGAAAGGVTTEQQPVEIRQRGPFLFGSHGRQNATSIDITFAVDAVAALQPGDYTVTVVVLDTRTNATIATQEHNLTRVVDSAPLPTVYVDQLKRTIVNGQPFFPLGWFFGAGEEMTPGGADYWRFELLALSPFNTVMPYV